MSNPKSKPAINTIEEHQEYGPEEPGEITVEAEASRKGLLEDHFLLAVVGGCLGGIVLVVVAISLVLTVVASLEQPPPDPVLNTEVRQLSSREQRVLSLFMKSTWRSCEQ